MSGKKRHAQAPEKLTGIELKKIPSSAVGYTAVKSAITHIKEEVGLVKGVGLLAKLNQKNGFDCPGCAWPDPDEKRAFLAEYCENGAKAVAEEATKKRVSKKDVLLILLLFMRVAIIMKKFLGMTLLT